MNDNTLKEMEDLFLALSDRTRLKLLSLMGSDEITVGYLCDALGQSQPKVSRHLAYLRTSGLVTTRRDGKWIFYKIVMPNNEGGQAVLRSALKWVSGDAGPVFELSAIGNSKVSQGGEQSMKEDTRFTPNEIDVHLL